MYENRFLSVLQGVAVFSVDKCFDVDVYLNVTRQIVVKSNTISEYGWMKFLNNVSITTQGTVS